MSKFLDWIGRLQTVQSIYLFAKPFLWPALGAALTGSLGIVGHQPFMWVVMAVALTFMAVTVGVYFARSYRDQISPAHKIRYNGTIVNYDLTSLARRARRAQQTGAIPARTIEKVQVGVSLHNSANYPITIFLENAETEMEGETPPRSMFPKQATTILPGNTVFVMDDPIDMNNHPCEKLEGHMNLRIKYGYKGREKFSLQFAGRVEVLMRPEGFIGGIYTHWDSELVSLPTR